MVRILGMVCTSGWLRRWALVCFLAATTSVLGDGPVLSFVFPCGGRAGTTVEVEPGGVGDASDLYTSLPGVTVNKLGDNKFGLAIPANATPGAYDVYAISSGGLSSPRTFTVSRRPEAVETEPNNDLLEVVDHPLTIDFEGAHGVVVNGRLGDSGDVDCHAFAAAKDQLVIVECWAERIDSQLRALVDLHDKSGRRLHVERHLLGLDPLLVFRAPADGIYVAKVRDLTHTFGDEHFYRLVFDTGPRVFFTHPCVVQQGRPGRVRLYGWNLVANADETSARSEKAVTFPISTSVTPSHPRYEFMDVDLPMSAETAVGSVPLRLRSTQISVNGFAYDHPRSNAPTLIAMTDVPVVDDGGQNHSAEQARQLEFPCEIAGQLASSGEEDWFAIKCLRGEVIWFEGFGERMDSPIDLDLTILDPTGIYELANFADERRNHGDVRFPTNHSDPSGRWVVPADGRYLFLVRNVTGAFVGDARRVYRVSVRREEPDFHLVVVSRRPDQPSAINVPAGGREVLEVLAMRVRGATGSIRVTALEVPAGFQCPVVWLHPGASRAPLVVSAVAGPSVETFPAAGGTLRLVGSTRLGGREIARPVVGGTMVRGGVPVGLGRLTAELPIGLAGKVPVRINASYEQTPNVLGDPVRSTVVPRLSQGSVITLAVDVEWLEPGLMGDIQLSGVGLPETVRNRVSTIAACANRGFISFYLPPSSLPGRYTLALEGKASVQDVHQESPPSAVTIYSNALSFEVYTAPMIVEIARDAPRKIRRGETVQIHYTVRRQNGFIGKIHTELAAPGGVIGLRGRGVSFAGQTETGNIQIVANEDAPLGRASFLRFEAAGYVEDEILYLGSCFADLEVIK